MKRILFVIDNLKGGGAEKVLITVLQHLSVLEKSIDLFLINKEGIYLDNIPSTVTLYYALGNSSFFLNKIKRRILLTFPSLFYIFYIRKKYDYYIAFREDTATRILLKAPITSKRIAWLHTDLERHKFCKTTNVRKYIEDLPLLTEIICVSEACRDALIRLSPAMKTKSKVIYNPIDVYGILQKSNDSVEIPFNKMNINILAVGRIDAGKNHKFLMDCMPLLLNKGNYVLWILGEGPLKVQLEELSVNMGLQEQIHFLGFKENPYPYIKASDVFVLSSLYEGLPTVVIEALVLKKNIVVSPCIGAEEVLCYGDLGYIASLDTASFSEAVINATSYSLLTEDKISRRISDFDLKQQISEIKALFR